MTRVSHTRRSLLLGGGAALLCNGRGGAATPQRDLVLRRPQRPGEDAAWYALCQNGPWNAAPQPTVIPFGAAPTVIHYPIGPESGRLIVFSHAALTDPQVYRPLLQHLASHGFVVAAPIHDDSVFKHGAEARTVTVDGAVTWDVTRHMNDVEEWKKRIEGCRSPMESADAISKVIGMRVDASRPIIAGHEFGAYVAGLVLGTVVDDDGARVTRFKDERWFAGAMMSAQGRGIMGLTETSWAGVTHPLLVIQGALETDYMQQQPGQKIDPYALSAPGNKHLAWFTTGDRTMYVNPDAGNSEQRVQSTEDVRAVLTAFAKSYSDYDRDVFAQLAGDWAERATLGRVQTAYR